MRIDPRLAPTCEPEAIPFDPRLSTLLESSRCLELLELTWEGADPAPKRPDMARKP